ncbi:uncharacterized protein DUF262 [Gillisia mitskevichiae]|uniref:Uncharacterized protein DUF262 n=1 Tax=Gillisia mitskevichiae TaxID=270921 RepID=A0A495PZC3_9FLAO|nr:DUF262 domain-containing protein [Gillisia mitskevichiae]RKS55876.1 uncharacterized protein DUF262 [Gillisia mitskevichiae]
MSSTTAFIELFEKNFVIPHYQRGYRWSEQEVKELLNDIWYFTKTSNNGEFYCLQPIVVQKINKNTYNVLDGQQRLTTLYLILIFLEERRFEDGYNKKLFTLKYETRPESERFLNNRKFIHGIDETNIDFYHISKSYNYIKEWFKGQAGAKNKLIPVLLDETDIGNKNIRFIWYEVASKTYPIDVFIRLNVGKIPLTDAELIKALLLQSDRYPIEYLQFHKMKLFEIASEWDTIEYTLQEEEFWYFLNNNENTKATHIEFIFDAIANKVLKEKKYFDSKNFKHATFLILSEYLEDLITNDGISRIDAVKKIWEMVIEYFEYYKEWFENRKLYHYIGYLIELKGTSIIDILIARSKKLPKDKFELYLENEIGSLVRVSKHRKDKNGQDIEIELKDLCYENEDQRSNDKPLITSILLLHNVVMTLHSEKEKAKFPFHLYKKTTGNEKWSLEHIHAQNSNAISNKIHQNTWLTDHIKSIDNLNDPQFKGILQKMKKALENEELENEEFDSLYNEVYKLMNEVSGATEKNTHLIENLCLIDKNTNSQLNNSVFDVKREKIKKRELQGYYIPICSRNVFLKVYTDYPQNNAYWTKEDRKGYLKSIKTTYDSFIKEKE